MGLMDCYMFNTIMKWNDRKMSDNMKTVSGNTRISGKAAKSALFALIGGAAALILDQVTKYMAVEHLMSQPPFEIISGVFELRYLENRGAAFGMMQNRQYLFVVGASIVMVILIFLYHRMPYTKRYTPLRFCAVLLWAGAAGNAIDRIRLGYVIDFFYFKLIDFPIFNVADCYVVVACFLFAFLILFYYREDDDFDFLSRKKKEGKIKES